MSQNQKKENPDLVPPETQQQSQSGSPNSDIVPPGSIPAHGGTPFRGNGGDRNPVPLFKPDGMYVGPDHPDFQVPGLYPKSPSVPPGPNARFDIIDPINPYGIPDPDEVVPRHPDPSVPRPKQAPFRGVGDLTGAPADDPANLMGYDPMGRRPPMPKTDPFGNGQFGTGGPFGKGGNGGGGGFPF